MALLLRSPVAVSRPWIAEIEMPPERAAALIGARFPELAGLPVEPFGNGWDNTAVLVDGRVVVRFPRRAQAVALLRTEASVLGRLGPLLPLGVPEPRFVAADGPGFPWPFVGYPLLPGRTACRADLDLGARCRAAPVLGAFLARLHGVRTDALALPGDALGRLRLTERESELEERLEVLRARGRVADPAPWLRRFQELGTGAARPAADTVVHGDLYARHLLVDDAGHLTGVIDWGDVHLGDAAADLMVAYAFLPASARRAFFDAYGPVAPGRGVLARRRALFHAVAVTWFGVEHGDEALAREGRRALDHVLEE